MFNIYRLQIKSNSLISIKKMLLIAGLLVTSLNSMAQQQKRFFDKNNKVIKDSAKAVSFIVCQKSEQDAIWTLIQYDMNHVPKLRGSFLDAELTIPHGKFVYYKQGTKQTKIDEHHSKIDTILYIVQTGVYLNGLKEGVWVLYNVNGNKASLKTYEAGKLNGLYEEYSFNGATLSRSMYIDDVREGDSYIFRSDSSIGRYIKFWHG